MVIFKEQFCMRKELFWVQGTSWEFMEIFSGDLYLMLKLFFIIATISGLWKFCGLVSTMAQRCQISFLNFLVSFQNYWFPSKNLFWFCLKIFILVSFQNFILVSYQYFWFPSKVYIFVCFQNFWFLSKMFNLASFWSFYFVFLPRFLF